MTPCSPWCRGCYIEDSRMTPEMLKELGLKGKPGFMGRGVYGSTGRRPGYLKGRGNGN